MDADLLAERENRQKYDGGPHYRPETICHMPDPSRAPAYIDGQFDAKMELVQRYCDHGVVVDLCCAAGDHLELFRMPRWRWGIGVDFSTSFLHHARHVGVGTRQDNLTFLCANARDLPLATQSVDSLYCLSSLYCIPRVEGVIREVARVLHPGGTCVLEFGCHSLNTLVCNAYPELANVGHISVKAMLTILSTHGLQLVEWRSFQLLPMWGDRPSWLRPLLHPFWCNFLKRKIHGKMLDEWISSLPFLRNFAFRHIIVARN